MTKFHSIRIHEDRRGKNKLRRQVPIKQEGQWQIISSRLCKIKLQQSKHDSSSCNLYHNDNNDNDNNT